ncbi:MAG: hypothetical protein JKY48_02725, partial [Flavobacteriales bacterium]|nr:hypothetical protein [Flavobacteriales bacterium]
MKKPLFNLIIILFLGVLNSFAQISVIESTDIDFNCFPNKEATYLIQNQTEFDELLGKNKYNSNCTIPEINFLEYSLIGFWSMVAGCQWPTIEDKIIDSSGFININIKVIQHGRCKRSNYAKFWALVP